MSRLITLTASALAVAAFTPAVAGASHNALRGAPQMFETGADAVQVKVVTDKAIRRTDLRVAVAGSGSARSATPDGRHGNDYRYIVRVKVSRDLEIGRKYTVRIKLGDDAAQTRQVVLRAKR